jgi:hypothetical protein
MEKKKFGFDNGNGNEEEELGPGEKPGMKGKRGSLEWYEMTIGGFVHSMRFVAALKQGKKDKRKLDPRLAWYYGINGTWAEIGGAKTYNKYWGGATNRWKAEGGDLEDGTEIKWASSLTGKMRIGHDDHPIFDEEKGRYVTKDRAYVLVVGYFPRYRVVGWMWGYEVKTHKEWMENPNDRGEAWFVPQVHLHEWDTLPAVPVRPCP